MKYKIGDKVRVRRVPVPDNYDEIHYAMIMDKFETTECVITNIMDGIYNINNSKYWFSAEMLELVDDEKILEYALEKLGMTKEELENEINRDEEDITFIEKCIKDKEELKKYCRKFNLVCDGCEIKKFKDKYKTYGKIDCNDVYKYLKKKGEI